jgi:two-component system nitrogen regulation response regulator GlnG
MGDNFCIWVADDDKSIRWVIEKALNKIGISTQCFTNAQSMIDGLFVICGGQTTCID